MNKSIGRRSFLRAAPAAVLAPATVAESVKNGLSSGAGIRYASFAGTPVPANVQDESGIPSWVTHEATELRKIISGEAREEREVHYDIDHLPRALHYDSLQSVSPVRRAQMFSDYRLEAERDRAKARAKFSLKRLIAEWGLIE